MKLQKPIFKAFQPHVSGQEVYTHWGIRQRLQRGTFSRRSWHKLYVQACGAPALPAHPFQVAGCMCRKASTLPLGSDWGLVEYGHASQHGCCAHPKASSWAIWMKALYRLPFLTYFIIFLKVAVKRVGNSTGCAHGFSSSSPRWQFAFRCFVHFTLF